MIISLIGFMAAGKTTVGQQLAASMKCQFIDLDAYIEEKEDKEVSEIFNELGEEAFRKMEEKYLEDVLEDHILRFPETLDDMAESVESKKCTLVISLGGGAVASPLCRDLIKNLTYCIYIKVDIDTILSRLRSTSEEVQKRPLLSGKDDLYKTIEALYYQREPLYEELADKISITN